MVIAGCFLGENDNIAWVIQPGDSSVPQPEPMYYSNAEEADIRIWKHAIASDAQNILIVSPDTDVYNIGLPVATHIVNQKNIAVQISMPSSHEKTFVNINNLLHALLNDGDLSALASANLPSIFISLFLATGSDYTSYFKTFGKVTVLNVFFNMLLLLMVRTIQDAFHSLIKTTCILGI
jgi:hypothetical protein